MIQQRQGRARNPAASGGAILRDARIGGEAARFGALAVASFAPAAAGPPPPRVAPPPRAKRNDRQDEDRVHRRRVLVRTRSPSEITLVFHDNRTKRGGMLTENRKKGDIFESTTAWNLRRSGE